MAEPLTRIPKRIEAKILAATNDKDGYIPMPNSYSITELVGCIRKTYYTKTNPKQIFDLATAKNFYRGNLWDRDFCGCYPRNQVRVTYPCHNVPISISGHFDFINDDDPANPIVTDLKSPKTSYYVKRENKPSEHYRRQVLFYCLCTAIPKGEIGYWDGNDWLGFPVEATQEAQQQLIEELEAKTTALYFALRNGKPPSKQTANLESWECSYCSFSKTCASEGQTKLTQEYKPTLLERTKQ
jgi:hypothetical protein